jgi:hypothetical protein
MDLATGFGHALGTDYYLIREQLTSQLVGEDRRLPSDGTGPRLGLDRPGDVGAPRR